MSRFIDKSMRSAAILFVVCAALTITGCGGGGGGGGGAGVAATVTQTSFQGQPAVPGGDLPPIFRDESLLFTFSAPIDTTSFGGLRLDGMGAPAQFVGFSAAASTGVPYFAFDNQTAAAMAFQIYENTMGAMQHPGVLGVSSVNPNVLVFDPRLRPTNPFGLPTSLGFNANLRYTIFIPAAGGLIAGGQPVAAFGSLPPATVPVFTPSPIPGRVFRAGPGFSPDTVPPTIDAIESMFHIQNSLPPTDPIPHNDTIIVTFSEPVDPATVSMHHSVSDPNPVGGQAVAPANPDRVGKCDVARGAGWCGRGPVYGRSNETARRRWHHRAPGPRRWS